MGYMKSLSLLLLVVVVFLLPFTQGGKRPAQPWLKYEKENIFQKHGYNILIKKTFMKATICLIRKVCTEEQEPLAY